MMNITESTAVGLTRLALDAAALNHQVIANNIANANTPGYQPARVSFGAQLDALRQTLRQGREIHAGMLQGIRPVIEREPALVGASQVAALDREAAKLAENTVHYQALLKALGKHYSIISYAINGGKH